jgi:hypothetical protein
VSPKLGTLTLIAFLSTLVPTEALELITPQMAALPNAIVPEERRLVTRALTRAPTVQLVLPPPDGGMVKSPLEIKIVFETNGGSQIDLNSVKVLYLKIPLLDLTERVAALIKPTGIDVPDAQLPPGTHFIRVEVMDADGRFGSDTFSIRVFQ